MASTSQISRSINSNRRRNSRLLLGFVLGGIALVVVPGVILVCQDAGQRSQLCQRLGTSVSTGIGNFSDLTSMFTGKNSSSLTSSSPGGNSTPTNLYKEEKTKEAKDKEARGQSAGVTASNVKLVDEAVKLLESKIEQNPKDASLHNRLGLIYAELGELGQAEAQFTHALEIARTGLAQGREELEQKKAAGQFDQASELMLSNSQNELELSTAHSNLARVFEKLGQQSKVVAQLDQLNKDVRIGDGLSPIGQTFGLSSKTKIEGGKRASLRVVEGMAKAEALMQAHLLPQAMHEWTQVVAIDPSIAEAHEKLGSAALTVGNIFLATQELKKAAQMLPGKANIHAALGICYQCRTRNKEAIDEFNKALSINNKDAQTAFNLGNAYSAVGQNKDARRCYLQAISLKPEMAVAHNNLATIYSISGDYDQAVEQFVRTLTLAPNMASAHYGLGLAYFNQKEYGRATPEFKIALALNPALVDAHTKLQLCARPDIQNNVAGNVHSSFGMGREANIIANTNSSGAPAFGHSRRMRQASNVDEGRHRDRASTINDSGEFVTRQRKVSMSSAIDEGSNRALVQRLN